MLLYNIYIYILYIYWFQTINYIIIIIITTTIIIIVVVIVVILKQRQYINICYVQSKTCIRYKCIYIYWLAYFVFYLLQDRRQLHIIPVICIHALPVVCVLTLFFFKAGDHQVTASSCPQVHTALWCVRHIYTIIHHVALGYKLDFTSHYL